jgi:hypothetical protein
MHSSYTVADQSQNCLDLDAGCVVRPCLYKLPPREAVIRHTMYVSQASIQNIQMSTANYQMDA